MRLINLNRILLTWSMLFLISAVSYANNQHQTHPSKIQMAPADPAYVIHTALDKITTFSSNSDKINPVKLRSFIEKQIIPHFDFDNMSHWITGRYARNMTDQDKSDFQRNLRETFLTSLSKHLGSFDAENTRIKFYPARYRGSEEAFVSTNVYRPQTMPVRLDFRMRRAGNAWKIIDVKANGSSAVLYYRRHFISQLRQFHRPPRHPNYMSREDRRAAYQQRKQAYQQKYNQVKQPVQKQATPTAENPTDTVTIQKEAANIKPSQETAVETNSASMIAKPTATELLENQTTSENNTTQDKNEQDTTAPLAVQKSEPAEASQP